MKTKLIFLIGAAVGYVLGSRAGRQRYEQIKMKSRELWNSDRVQHKVAEAGEAVKATAPVVGQKIGDAARHATDAAKTKLGHSDTDEASQATAPFDPVHTNGARAL